MLRSHGLLFLVLVVLAGGLAGTRLLQGPRRTVPLENWDIPQVTAHLERQGLRLRVVPVRKDGPQSQGVFLTTTEHDWSYLNCLGKNPGQIEKWRGTLYCDRGAAGRRGLDLDGLWGDCYLVAGPFLFFGDPALLARVRAALPVAAG